jgi:hypothetical protein
MAKIMASAGNVGEIAYRSRLKFALAAIINLGGDSIANGGVSSMAKMASSIGVASMANKANVNIICEIISENSAASKRKSQ